MDYLLDSYVFRYLPFGINPEIRKNIIGIAMKIVAVADWWCKARELQPFLDNHPTLVVAEFIYVLLWLLTLCHAIRHGSRYLYTWIGVCVLAFFVEMVKFMDKSTDIVWYTQTTLTFMGMRTPFYLLCGVYHTLFYITYVMVRRMRLKWWGEAAANGIFILLLSFPLQVLGTKLLWWQWHDSDPRLKNTLYSVPIVVLALHSMLAASFNLSLYLFRKRFLREKYDWRRFVSEFFCVIGAAFLTLCLTALQYIVFFHTLHDILQINSIIAMALLLIIYAGVALKALFRTGLKAENSQSTEVRHNGWRAADRWDELTVAVIVHFLLHMLLVVISSPVDAISEGIHQTVGPCDEMERIFSPFGQALYRRSYFCLEKQNQKQFDFHCIPAELLLMVGNNEHLEYYAICGTDFENQTEYITLLWTYCVKAFFVIYFVVLSSGPTALFPVKMIERKSSSHGKTNKKHDRKCQIIAVALPRSSYGFEKDRIVRLTSENIDDLNSQIRHRPKFQKSDVSTAKGSRLPTPTRHSSRLPKTPT